MTILLIDDDYVFRVITKKQLELCDVYANIIEAEDGEEAIKILKDIVTPNKIDIILLDVNMPVMNGWEFLELFSQHERKKSFQNITIWIVTSSTSPSDINRAKSYSCVKGYINKPLKKLDLMNILTDLKNQH